jgi:hypothetical protein
LKFEHLGQDTWAEYCQAIHSPRNRSSATWPPKGPHHHQGE